MNNENFNRTLDELRNDLNSEVASLNSSRGLIDWVIGRAY